MCCSVCFCHFSTSLRRQVFESVCHLFVVRADFDASDSLTTVSNKLTPWLHVPLHVLIVILWPLLLCNASRHVAGDLGCVSRQAQKLPTQCPHSTHTVQQLGVDRHIGSNEIEVGPLFKTCPSLQFVADHQLNWPHVHPITNGRISSGRCLRVHQTGDTTNPTIFHFSNFRCFHQIRIRPSSRSLHTSGDDLKCFFFPKWNLLHPVSGYLLVYRVDV